MNYSDLPVYIRQEDSLDSLSFANIYDPTGVDNSLYMINKSTTKNTSVRYLSGSFTRVSGNALNYQQLFGPKINYTAAKVQIVQIVLPQFRSLVFHNLNGSRTIDPQFPDSFLPPLYFYDYDSASDTINYVNFNRGDYYLALRWSGSNDR